MATYKSSHGQLKIFNYYFFILYVKITINCVLLSLTYIKRKKTEEIKKENKF